MLNAQELVERGVVEIHVVLSLTVSVHDDNLF